jgi:hypothetical protein
MFGEYVFKRGRDIGAAIIPAAPARGGNAFRQCIREGPDCAAKRGADRATRGPYQC